MHIVIIGNGIAGISTARHVRKRSDHQITVISSETDFFWSRTALMYIFMGHMRFEHTQPYEDDFWKKNRITLLRKFVTGIDEQKQTISFAEGGDLSYDRLVLATGSRSNRYDWPGQDLAGVQGMVSYQDLLSMEQYARDTRRAVVVGGGLIGIEMAEMFHSRHIPVTFLVREESFWSGVMPPEESAMINREILRHGIDLRLKAELREILADEHGRVRAVKTKAGEEISCEFVGLTTGVSPNVSLAAGTSIEVGRGFLVDEYLQTSVPHIYAIGDCAELRIAAPNRRGIEAVWYTGKLMGPVLAETLTGNPRAFVQQTWFNSAKFLDIEWQTYGHVPNRPGEGEQHLVWEHPDGKKLIRIAYRTDSGAVLGFNLMGIRYRKDVCIQWIDTHTHIEVVLANLALANFDPEFYPAYEQDLVDTYNQQSGQSLQLKKKRSLRDVFAFLQPAK